MAIDLSTAYPSQVDTSDPSGYPYGKPRNETASGARNGFPFEQQWMQDLHGFLQSILKAPASPITPSGTPDKVGASQYLDAVRAVIDAKIANYEQHIALVGTYLANFASAQLSGPLGYLQTNDGSPPAYLVIPIVPPSTSVKLDGVTVYCCGNYGGGTPHAAGKPATMPKVELVRMPNSGNVSNPTVVDTATDLAATAGDYDGDHSFGINALNHAIVPGNAYYLRITGESGTNAVADQLLIHGVRLGWRDLKLAP